MQGLYRMKYFLEVKYLGTNYGGFQVQQNAITIQSEVERVMAIFFKTPIKLTGASRTDAGVHARQNFFHFNHSAVILPRVVYNLNAMLPNDIAVIAILPVGDTAHSRFDAVSREYCYYLYTQKDPFLYQTAWYYPYLLNLEVLQQAASLLMEYTDFTSFAKRNSQVHTHNCTLFKSHWQQQGNSLVYNVKANRFLRGMVRGLVGTMLQVGRGTNTIKEFRQIIEAKDCTKANFTTPPQGLFLHAVEYPPGLVSVV